MCPINSNKKNKLFFTILAVYENNEKYDILVGFIQTNQNPEEASILTEVIHVERYVSC